MLIGLAGDVEQYGRGGTYDLPEDKAAAFVESEVAVYLTDIHPKAKEIQPPPVDEEKAKEIPSEPIHPEAAAIETNAEQAVQPKVKRKYVRKK